MRRLPQHPPSLAPLRLPPSAPPSRQNLSICLPTSTPLGRLLLVAYPRTRQSALDPAWSPLPRRWPHQQAAEAPCRVLLSYAYNKYSLTSQCQSPTGRPDRLVWILCMLPTLPSLVFYVLLLLDVDCTALPSLVSRLFLLLLPDSAMKSRVPTNTPASVDSSNTSSALLKRPTPAPPTASPLTSSSMMLKYEKTLAYVILVDGALFCSESQSSLPLNASTDGRSGMFFVSFAA
jgi:hypothetical protein